ncbi:heme-binding protein [Asaia bogorensis]|uniref:GlcG/HbpS family heme-binding protein n=1 Tax=Asaia bogorensis TaxID=91915 RepID=UPI000EFCC853|nr:heme-binding protein [Asaia bogorensis]
MQLATALDYIDRALQIARERGVRVAVAVVDAGGHLVAFKKDDGTQLGSIELALSKARTSALFLRPTEDMEKALHAGKTMIAALPNVLPAGGGAPIMVNGAVIGALGLSGGEGETDARLAEATIKAFGIS